MKAIALVAMLILACGRKTDGTAPARDPAPAPQAPGSDRLGPRPDGAVVLARGLNMVSTVLADDHALYWLARGGTTEGVEPRGVYRMLDGGTAAKLANATSLASLAQNRTDLFIGNPLAGTITRLPKAGGSPEVVASELFSFAGLAADDTAIYYLWGAELDDSPPADPAHPGDALWRRSPHAGAKPERLATDLGMGQELIVDGDALYVKQVEGTTITRIPTRGGAAQVVVTDPANTGAWTVSHGTIYYERLRHDDGDVVRVVPGGRPEVIARTSSRPEGGIAVAGDTVYIATDDGDIVAASPRGSTTLALRDLAPDAMVVRDHALVIAELRELTAIPLR